jgi:hypothetical protein
VAKMLLSGSPGVEKMKRTSIDQLTCCFFTMQGKEAEEVASIERHMHSRRATMERRNEVASKWLNTDVNFPCPPLTLPFGKAEQHHPSIGAALPNQPLGCPPEEVIRYPNPRRHALGLAALSAKIKHANPTRNSGDTMKGSEEAGMWSWRRSADGCLALPHNRHWSRAA